MALGLVIKFPVLALLVEQTAYPQNPFAKSSHGNLLLLTKHLHRIDSCRTAGWQPAGQQTGDTQKHNDTRKSHWVRRRNAVELARNETRSGQARHQSHPASHAHWLHSLSQDQLEHIA